jgi:hypothetical protein
LESHKTVTGDDVAAVIEGRQGPLVDGRPYHDPAFIARLEAYHRSALAAHKDHSNVHVSLPEPVLVGVAAGEAESGIGLGGNGDGVRGNGGASLPPRPDEG